MMATSSNAPSIGRIQKRKTNFSKSSLSACNARPVHTDGPISDIGVTRRHSLPPINSHGRLTTFASMSSICLDPVQLNSQTAAELGEWRAEYERYRRPFGQSSGGNSPVSTTFFSADYAEIASF